MSKSRKSAAPTPDPLPSLKDLWAAYDLRRADCRKNHRHTPMELAECDRLTALDWRVAEFSRQVAIFFDKIHPGKTLPTLPEGEYQRELDRIAEFLRVRPPRAVEAAHLVHQMGSVRPVPIAMHVKDAGAALKAKLAFDQAVKDGKPVKVIVENGITGEWHVEWQVWKADNKPSDNSRHTTAVPTFEAVRELHEKQPRWGAPMIASATREETVMWAVPSAPGARGAPGV